MNRNALIDAYADLCETTKNLHQAQDAIDHADPWANPETLLLIEAEASVAEQHWQEACKDAGLNPEEAFRLVTSAKPY
ncbi:hypothetical protein [Nocardiopsis rhodophaea]|uniref:hypothetical protein n=1 Tax=Nocardiopsis rhodophaea TaxID=280238 RepID=UPI0031D7975C